MTGRPFAVRISGTTFFLPDLRDIVCIDTARKFDDFHRSGLNGHNFDIRLSFLYQVSFFMPSLPLGVPISGGVVFLCFPVSRYRVDRAGGRFSPGRHGPV